MVFGILQLWIVAISISSFQQYYFGIVNRLLLTADQRDMCSILHRQLRLLEILLPAIYPYNVGLWYSGKVKFNNINNLPHSTICHLFIC